MTKISSVIIFLLVFVCSAATSFAQTQQGVVKTRGKMVNGTHVPGQGLPGAVVSVKGRGKVLVQNENGEFSFSTPDSKFKLDSVSKKGYVLVDFDCVGQELTQSENAVNLVMETPSQLLEDKLAVERKIRRSLEKQLMAKEDELEALREQNKITVEEYHKLVQDLYVKDENNRKLVSQMAEKYSKLDYDQLDDFYKKVSDYIINGELTKADSLLSTKGNLNDDIAQLKRLQAANTQEREELDRREENLKKSKSVEQFKLEDLAKRCYTKYEICKLRYEYDSAAYYLEARANLDTTNVRWTLDFTEYMSEYMVDLDKYTLYVDRALNHMLDISEGDDPLLAGCYNAKAHVCFIKADIPAAQEYTAKSLDMYLRLFGESHQKVAEVYGNIGEIYRDMYDFPAAISYYSKSLDILLDLYGENNKDVVAVYTLLGDIYAEKGEYSEALRQYNKAYDIIKRFMGVENEFIPYIYSRLGGISSLQKKHAAAIDYGKKAIDVTLKVYGNEHPALASSYMDVALLYSQKGDNNRALELYNEAIKIYTNIGRKKIPAVAKCYMEMGNIYMLNFDDNESALDCYQKALDTYRGFYGENHTVIADDYICFALVYRAMNDNDSAIKYQNMALEIYMHVYGESHPKVSECLNVMGLIYIDAGNYEKALEYFHKALASDAKIYGSEHPNLAPSYSMIGTLYNNLENYDSAIEFKKKSLDIKVSTWGEFCEEAGEECHRIGYSYLDLKNYPMALEYLQKALEIKKRSGDKDKIIPILKDDISNIEYILALDSSDSDFQNYMSDKMNVISLAKNEEPIIYKGLKGESYLLEVEDWAYYNKEAVFEKIEEYSGKAKRVLIMNNGKITEMVLDESIEMWFSVKQIGKKEKDKINKLYKEWKQK